MPERRAVQRAALFEHVFGGNIHRYPMFLTSLEYQVSKLVNSDTCPRPTTQLVIDDTGALVGSYRKTHPGITELPTFGAGVSKTPVHRST